MYYYEACSLRQIEAQVDKGYEHKRDVREHLEFLESLADTINQRMVEGQQAGAMAWGEKMDLEKVQSTFFHLTRVLNDLESKSKTKPIKPKALF